MKNIHVLPTNKPSRLYYNGTSYKDPNSTMAMDWFISSAGYKPQNIYITSDEEIKEGDWVYNIVSKTKFKATKQLIDLINDPNVALTTNKKIILTTDQDLIKDGIQAIDDKFLEWFVKNPSCEEVEVKKEYITPLGDIVETCYDNERLNYQIIIPKEEPTIEEEYLKDELKKYDGIDVVVLNKPEEPKQYNTQELEGFEDFKKLVCPKQHDVKQKTLKEYDAESYLAGIKSDLARDYWCKQQERMYSEMDIVLILSKFRDMKMIAFSEWFELFKKK